MSSIAILSPVRLVSLGPGDPELITLKGQKALQQADVIFCPSTVLPRGGIVSRAQEILLQLGLEAAHIQLFSVPMSKDRSLALAAYAQIATLVAEQYQQGRKVAVVAEGDAGFYSSSHYIFEYLFALHIPVEQIAGIPAFIACGALANLLIVKQTERLEVVPGLISVEELQALLEQGKTVVVMKASQCESVIKKATECIPASFHYFEHVGMGEQSYYTSDIQDIRQRSFPYFSLFIIQNKI